MVNVAYEIERLVKFAVRKKMITVWDIIPVRNSLRTFRRRSNR